MNFISTILNFVFLLQSALGGFLLQGNFTNTLNRQFSNLSQFEGISSSPEKSRQMKNAMSALLNVTAQKITKSPGYRMPFEANCSVFFDKQIEKIICDTNFENVRPVKSSCAAVQEFSADYIELLRKNHILQILLIVGLDPVQQPQAMYWLYFKLQPTPTLSDSEFETLTDTVSLSDSSRSLTLAIPSTQAPTTLVATTAVPTTMVPSTSMPTTLISTTAAPTTLTPSTTVQTTAIPSTQAPTTSTPTTLVPTTAPSSSTPLIYTCTNGTSTPPTNGLLAAWNASSGVYADATNQINRYNISNWTVLDTLTGIIWEQNVSSTTMNFTQAQSYCAGRNTGGLSGWRVPNIVELNTMCDYTLGSPRVNTTVFPGTTAVSFWSSSPEIGNGGGNAWDLELGNQYIYYTANSTLERVRCVMACYPILPAGRYVNASGEVTDLVTGLIWQQVSTGSTMNWTNALTHCTGLGLNGHAWRLPRIRELATLVDYSASYATLMMNLTVFPGEPASWFWSSTPVAGDPSGAWGTNFNRGDLYFLNVTGNNYVRCLR